MGYLAKILEIFMLSIEINRKNEANATIIQTISDCSLYSGSINVR